MLGRNEPKRDSLKRMTDQYRVSYFCDDNPANLIDVRGIVNFPVWRESIHYARAWDAVDKADMLRAATVSDILKIAMR